VSFDPASRTFHVAWRNAAASARRSAETGTRRAYSESFRKRHEARAVAAYAGRVRAVDLAVFADVLAGRASSVAARLERARDAIRQAALEREVRAQLDGETVERLEALGVLSRADARSQREEAARLAADLRAIERLQAWVEERLFEAREERDAA
jgi:hypothetical protein